MGKLEQIYLAKRNGRRSSALIRRPWTRAGLVGDRYHKLAETHLAEDCRCWRTMSAGRAGSTGQIFINPWPDL